MNAYLQTVAALAIVAVAVLLLVWSAVKRRKNPGCGGSCACPTSEIKAKLKNGYSES